MPLIERMVEFGAVVSEMPIEQEPRGRDFPRRNRIVSGLALGTIVVEAARGSGSLITARFALEQNRQVFAVPGSPLDPRAEGTNDLLKQGATICTGVDDVLAALEPMRSRDLFSALEEGGAGEPQWGEQAFDGEPPRAGGATSARRPFDQPAARPTSPPIASTPSATASPRCSVPRRSRSTSSRGRRKPRRARRASR